MSITERQARMGLAALLPLANWDLANLVATQGAVEVWQQLRAMGRESGWGRKAAGLDLAQLAAATKACNARFLIPGDEEWPEQIADLDRVSLSGMGAAPLGLWLRGAGTLPHPERAVAVVGARAASAYGEHVSTQLAQDLAQAGYLVVSGMAFGIDAASHAGALAAGRPTLAVLACGVDLAYPLGNAQLMNRILADGLVVSEVPPGSRPLKASFLARNRIIAALAQGVVIVEAAARSGARNTVSWASELGRVVMAVPGPVTSTLSITPNRLIRDQEAILVADAKQVQALLAPLNTIPEAELHGEPRPLDRLPGSLRSLREAVAIGEVVDAAELSARTGMSIMECVAGAQELAETGWLVQLAGAAWRLPKRADRSVAH
ncbi:MAG: DNA-protecting protein DprA [Propionibacterium sp.]|nr:MAG: DNA-protecting protein DprA [Propionibacterium sp.]